MTYLKHKFAPFCMIVIMLLPFMAHALSQSVTPQPQAALNLPLDPTKLQIEISPDQTLSFDLEIARTAEQKQRGLMFRTDFPDDRAMLFAFDRIDLVYMWMENTPKPLDMIFLDQYGRITHIHRGAQPFSQAIISSQKPAAYVIEINAGLSATESLKPGMMVKHPAICETCRGE